MGLLKKAFRSFKKHAVRGTALAATGGVSLAFDKKTRTKFSRILKHPHIKRNYSKYILGQDRHSIPVMSSASDLANANAFQYQGRRISDLMR